MGSANIAIKTTPFAAMIVAMIVAMMFVASGCGDEGPVRDSGPAAETAMPEPDAAPGADGQAGTDISIDGQAGIDIDGQATDDATADGPGSGDATADGQEGSDATADGGGTPTGAWPDDSNTGIKGVGLSAAQLSPSPTTGAWTITTDGAVFDTFHHKGTIEINADNVTLKRCLIAPGGPVWKVVHVTGKNAVIEDCTIIGNSTVAKTCNGCISGRNYTARRINASGCADGFKLGGDVLIEDSYSHGLFKHGDAATGTHNDSLQLNNGGTAGTVTIRGNAFYHYPCNSNRHLQVGSATINELYIESNFFFGSHGVLNFAGSTIGSGHFSDNVLAGSRSSGPFSDGGGNKTGPGLYTGPGVQALSFSGNLFESGESVDTDTRLKGQYTCIK